MKLNQGTLALFVPQPSFSICIDLPPSSPVGAPSLLFHFLLLPTYTLLFSTKASPARGLFILFWCLCLLYIYTYYVLRSEELRLGTNKREHMAFVFVGLGYPISSILCIETCETGGAVNSSFISFHRQQNYAL